jgi:sugar/nucleoside kinase (ribokinase family)
MPTFAEAVKLSHFLCANLDEATILAGTVSVPEYARRESKNGRLIIVKMGARGCLVAKDGKTIEIPGFNVNAVDTTGAGDAFLGSVLYGLARGITVEKSALFANWFASHITSGIGARHFRLHNMLQLTEIQCSTRKS